MKFFLLASLAAFSLPQSFIMPQVTVFNSQQQIVNCYIISDELFTEIDDVISVFDMNIFYLSWLEEFENRFLSVLAHNLSQHLPHDFDSQTVNLFIKQNFPWYLELLELIKYLRSIVTEHDGLSLKLVNSAP